MRVAATIDEVPVAALDRMGDCLYSSGFLRFVEREHAGRARTLYFYDGDGSEIRSFTVGYVYRAPIPFTFRLEEFLGDASAGSYLVLNAPFRLRSRVLASDQGAQEVLLAEVLEWARQEAIGAVVLPFVLGSDHALREVLAQSGFFSAFYEGDFYLPVTGGTLEEFLMAQRPEPRKQLRNDLNRLRRSSVEIDPVTEVADFAESFAGMHRVLMEKYDRTEPELDQGSIRAFAEEVGCRWIVVAKDAGKDVGFAMSLFDRQTFHLLRYGRAAMVDETARIYGNLVYLESLRKAIELGCRRVHFGKASHRAKVLRGCQYEEGIAYVHFLDGSRRDDARDLFAMLDSRNRERFAGLLRGVPA